MSLAALQLITISMLAYTSFYTGPIRQELDFPEGRCGGHAPTGVSWTAPEDVTVDVSLDAWKLRNNANAYITVWVNGEKRLDKVLIPAQSVTCNSNIPYTLSQMLEDGGGKAGILDGIHLKSGEAIIIEIGGNDYAGLDLSIKSDQELWDLAGDFSYESKANTPWSYGQVEVGTNGTPGMIALDTVVADFNPDSVLDSPPGSAKNLRRTYP